MNKKQLLLIGAILFSNLVFAEEIIVPENIKEEITKYAVENVEEKRGAYVQWQLDAYKMIEKKLAESTLTEEEKVAVKVNLKKMYGINYARQTRELEEQMEIVPILYKAKTEKIESAKRNETSKEELKTIVQENQDVVSKKYMDHIQTEATRLYPENIYEQKRYIESSINTYKMFFKGTK